MRTYSWARGEPIRDESLFVGCAEVVQDLVQLVDVVAALEEGTCRRGARRECSRRTRRQLEIVSVSPGGWRKSSQGPVELRTGFCVALEAQHDLGGPVPSGSDVLGHVACVLLGVHGETPGQTKIADLELAVGIDEQVTGLQISVQDVGRVDILETAQDLVDEGLEVGVGEGLAGSDNGSQIAFHELCQMVSTECHRAELDDHRTLVEIGLVEVVWAGNVHVIETCDLRPLVRTVASMLSRRWTSYVAVAAEVLQQLDLAQGTLREDLLAEDIGDLLDGHTFAGLVVGGSAVRRISICMSAQVPREDRPTRQCRMRPGPAPLSRCIARRR